MKITLWPLPSWLRISFISFALIALFGCSGPGSAEATEGDQDDEASPMKYTSIDAPNAEGFAKVTAGEGGSYAEGIIDTKGKEIIPSRTDMLANDITALVQVVRAFLFVDLDRGPIDTALLTTGKEYQYTEPFRCGRAMVQVDDRWFYIDTNGTQVFGTTYDFAETFHYDRAMVKEGEHYRIIDTAGKTVAKMPYDQVNVQSPWRWQVANSK